MAERIRDATVAEAIAAEAGTDATPELVLSEVVSPVVLLQQRPPLASSGYYPGTVGGSVPGVALNTSHIGVACLRAGGTIARVNFMIIQNNTGGALSFQIRRVAQLNVGSLFLTTPDVPGYIPAGNTASGGGFLARKTDTVAPVGLLMTDDILVVAAGSLRIPGPWLVNDGILSVNCKTVNSAFRAVFGYEMWPVVRAQPEG